MRSGSRFTEITSAENLSGDSLNRPHIATQDSLSDRQPFGPENTPPARHAALRRRRRLGRDIDFESGIEFPGWKAAEQKR